MKAKDIICFILSEEEILRYKDEEFGLTEMDSYKFLSRNGYCRYFDWMEGIENLSEILSFVEKRVLDLKGETLSIPQRMIIKKYGKSPLFREKGGWMQFVLFEISLVLQCYQLNLVIWDLLDDGYRILITTESKALSLFNMSLDEGCFRIQNLS